MGASWPPTQNRMFIITDKDTELDDLMNPSKLIERVPAYKKFFETTDEMRHQTDDVATMLGHEHLKGYFKGDTKGGLKVVARLRESQLVALLHVEPDLLKDGKLLDKLIAKYPAYRAYTNARI